MRIERGVMGHIPWAAVGSGQPLVLLCGLSPHTGVASDRFVRAALSPVVKLASRRQVFVLNRRSGLSDGLAMTGLAEEHAQALRSRFAGPVDLIGLSTGGSIAQQLAADHPDIVRRLVLVSTACRLGVTARQMQAGIAAELRGGRIRAAMSLAAAGMLPKAGWIARGAGWIGGPRLVGDSIAAADLAVTLEAEDGFDLALNRAAIRSPTLIIAGGRDRYYSAALFEETAALIPHSQLRVYPGKGHIAVTLNSNAGAHIEGFLSWDRPDEPHPT